MAKHVPYVQCALQRAIAGGSVRTVSYIPKQFAKLGRVLKLKEDGQWVDGWVVESVGSTVVDAADVPVCRTPTGKHR